ncbi:hypothetical protein [Microbacterium sp. SLBN-146]|uniref:hypothetical protein n=1 Tax=Microbacterium sp. SLBN-146 TaxID=2768457 RepID=UPI00114FA0A1|nr:hypothetical protein [Microbacterium sp. SLBN-146]TQJ31309.1 hypothetical protein FBY39_1773 [Microbacterium sp. SLBN-146]
MKKQILFGTGALLLVAAPAVIGLWGNASFAQSVPVRVPVSGQVMTATPMPMPTATPTPSASVGDDGTIDDHGGDVPRDQRTEPGDDRRVNGAGSDDSSGRGGGDDSSDDHGGDD